MKYENAKEILPAQLLAEVQKYAGGKLLYIPVENDSKSWGEASGYRQKLLKRNVMIANRYKAGVTMAELAEEYFLSYDSIKKIVYGKKEKDLLFEATVESAVCYANAGLLEEWLTLYYQMICGRQELSLEEKICCGVVKVPLRLVESEALERNAEENGLSTSVESGISSNEPLIINYQNGSFTTCCHLELYDSLVYSKVNAYPAVIMVSKEEYKQFEWYYGRYFVVVN